jgi:hypothetical protein
MTPAMARALETTSYEMAKIQHVYEEPDSVFGWVEALNGAVADYVASDAPLADVYPRLVRVAALALLTLSHLPGPAEIDGLIGFDGLTDDRWSAPRPLPGPEE